MALRSAKLRCKWSPQAPNIYRMGWRRFVNELLLISPLLFLACITVQARTRIESFRPLEYTPSLDNKIAAYIEPVRLYEQRVAGSKGRTEPNIVRRVGEVWREGVQMGLLRPLLPEVPGDSTREGIKGQIRAAADELGAQLQVLARSSFAEGNYAQAASDALLSIEATQSVKYSDLYAVGVMSMRQNNALALLTQCVEHLTAGQKASIAIRIDAVKQSERPIADLVLAEQRTLTEEEQDGSWTRSHRKRLELLLALADQLDNDHLKHELSDLPSEIRKMGRIDDVGSVLPSLRLAWNARRNSNGNWRNIEAKLALNSD